VLCYLETPQYLRKALFPVHRDLKYAGLLNPIDAPHHMRIDDDAMYREAVVLGKPGKAGSWVNAGMRRECLVRGRRIPPGTRVTVKIDGAGCVFLFDFV
jgi:predicted SPOUT superfamily RNA methylase MTH1